MQNKDAIFRIILNERKTLENYGVKSIGLFGSFVRGEQTALSDIDILVEFFHEKHTFDNFMDLAFFLEALLEHKIDLITPESLSPYIAPHILKEVERVSIAP